MTKFADDSQDRPVESPNAVEKPPVPTWLSEKLLGGSHEARIVHGNETYRLIRTRNDKLILVK